MIETLRNRPLIINADLDGIISGLFLVKFLNCSIVGFSNSKKEVWLRYNFQSELQSICFVDLFVANPDILCIDQHIVAGNQKHFDIISKNTNKINPNFLNPRYHHPSTSYKQKYPFGTLHFIIALLEKYGMQLDEIDLKKEIQGIRLIDLILRADDCMKTSIYSNYGKNAVMWWKWLLQFSKTGSMTQSLKNYLEVLEKKEAEDIKRKLSRFFKNAPYNCDSSDGGINELSSNGFLKENVFHLFELLCDFIDLEAINLGGKFKKYSGVAKRLSLNNTQLNQLIQTNSINDQRVFSYAFVRTAERDENLSVTFYQN